MINFILPLSFRLSDVRSEQSAPFVIPIERTPGANRGICCYLNKKDMNLLEGQIPPLRNASSRSRYFGQK